MTEDQLAAIPVTDECLRVWEIISNAEASHMDPGCVNWVMIVRSLIAEIYRLKKSKRSV